MLKCVSCHRFLFPPILQCLSGHMECKNCFELKPQCGKCNQVSKQPGSGNRKPEKKIHDLLHFGSCISFLFQLFGMKNIKKADFDQPKCLLKYKNTLNNFIELETNFYWKLIENLVFINATDHNTMVTSREDS